MSGLRGRAAAGEVQVFVDCGPRLILAALLPERAGPEQVQGGVAGGEGLPVHGPVQEPKGFFGKLRAKLRASRAERRRKKAAERAAKEAKKPKKETPPRKKAKLTLNILVTILRGAGRLTKAVFGSLRVTKIRVCLGVRGEDPAEAARAYGRLNAWLYPSLGVIDRFVYLDFEELRILPDFGSAEPTVADRVSFRLSARLLFIVAAAVRVLYEFWREKVLDVFL